MNPEERAALGDIGRKGLWENNTALVQLLGMCPLLAVSTSFVNAVSLSLATVLVMALSGGVVAALRTLIPHEIRIPVFILIIAALVTCLDLAFNAWLHELYLVLGIFIPLIVTNCIVLARVEAFAAKNSPLAATWKAPSTQMSRWPPRIMAKLSAWWKYTPPGSSVTGCLPALMMS